MSGRMVCPDCQLAGGQTVRLRWYDLERDWGYLCAYADIDARGAFDLGVVAPSTYMLDFSGRVQAGGTATASVALDVCTTAIVLEDTLAISEE